MTEFNYLTDKISVSGQIQLSDLDTFKEAGIARIVMNRPDGEEPGQPETSGLRKRANELDIEWIDNPIKPGQVTPDAVAATVTSLIDDPKRTHVFCKSGGRCTILWGLAEAKGGKLGVEDILKQADQAGYDISPAMPALTEMVSARP